MGLALLLFVLAFASSSETAFFSLNRFQLRRIKERYRGAHGRIRTLLSRPSRLLITILLMSELANLAFSSIITSSLERHIGMGSPSSAQWYLVTGLSMLISLPLLLLLGEITPKVMATKMNRVLAIANSRILIVLYRILFPLLWILDTGIGFVLRSLKAEGRDHLSKTMSVLSEEDVMMIMEEGHREGTVDRGERELIKNVFEFDDTTVSEAMTPIAQAFSISANAKISEILPDIRSQKYSRVPIYGKTKRNTVGILYVKDLLALRNPTALAQTDVKSLMAQPMFVGPNMRLSLLFRRFKEAKTHMAVVVSPVTRARVAKDTVPNQASAAESPIHEHFDEEAVGVITLEDVLESLFGEIADERDLE